MICTEPTEKERAMSVEAEFAERILNGPGAAFAARIRKHWLPSGAEIFPETPRVLFKPRRAASSDQYFYQLLLRLNRAWQKEQAWKAKSTARREAFAQSIVKRMERFVIRTKAEWSGTPLMQKELTVFRDIAAIFVHRGSRPDLAKKAERDLVKILNREYREHDPPRNTGEAPVYQRRTAHEELVTTKRTLAGVEEQLNRQKTLLLQLQKSMETAIRTPEPDMGKLTDEVMKRMEREMHLERLRRG
ncbi:MAG: hypothetical protein NC409_04415 [Clostridium sp.]|nr:hypothetical protein [Clostridium sp.]